MTTIAVRVAEIIEETTDIRSLRLVRDDGAPVGPYRAGAHIDVLGPTGILRQYSLCHPPQESSSLMIAVKREPASRGGSSALHTVSVGDALRISEPRNLLTVRDDAADHCLVAGGIGITPLLSIAYELHDRDSEFELHYFARSQEEAAFHDLLTEKAGFRDRVWTHLGVPPDEVPGVLSGIASTRSRDSHVYTCGPQGFMDEVTASCSPVIGEHQIHVEHFVATEVDTNGDTAFTVELDTGEEFQVPADRSILSVLTENGIDVFKSCEEGICGSCVSGVLEGQPDHRDNCLSASEKAEGDQMALCVSRALSDRLVIELY